MKFDRYTRGENPYTANLSKPGQLPGGSPPECGMHTLKGGPPMEKFMTAEQIQEMTRVVHAALKEGQDPNELTATCREWLRTAVTEAVLEKAGWNIDKLAELTALAGLLAWLVVRHRMP